MSRSEVNTGAFCYLPSYSFKDSDSCEFYMTGSTSVGVKKGWIPGAGDEWHNVNVGVSSGGAARVLNL